MSDSPGQAPVGAPVVGGGAGAHVARVPAPALFVASGFAQYIGAGIAARVLFPEMAPEAVAWLRITAAALVLAAWRRPWRSRWGRRALAWTVAFGIVLCLMNVTFYVAIDNLPLGTAVAIEFIGPVAVAAITGRSWRERAGIALAAPGVVLLAGVTLQGGAEDDVVLGLVAIGLAAVCWAGYILLGRRVALSGDGVRRLAAGMAVGAVVLAPVLAPRATIGLGSWQLLVTVFGVAVLSSVIPYAVEQVVLGRVSAATFAVLLALLPATAAASGAFLLRQWPHPLDVVGLVLVSGAIALTSRHRPEPVAEPDAGA